MPPKAKLSLDTSFSTSAPPSNPRPGRPKDYVNHVGKLRNPSTASPLNTWMTTGRLDGKLGDLSRPRRPRRPEPLPEIIEVEITEVEITEEEYENFFGQSPSGSLSGSMGGYVSARLQQAREEDAQDQEEEICGAEEQDFSDELSEFEPLSRSDKSSASPISGFIPFTEQAAPPIVMPVEVHMQPAKDDTTDAIANDQGHSSVAQQVALELAQGAQKGELEQYAYPPGTYSEDRSNDEYLAQFASFVNPRRV